MTFLHMGQKDLGAANDGHGKEHVVGHVHGNGHVQKMTHDHGKMSEDHAGHEKHAGHSLKMFANKFWVSLILTIPILLYSELPQIFFDWQSPAFFGSSYVPFILSSIIFFYGGWIFIKGARRELEEKLPGMMTLIALAIFAAYLYSVFITFTEGHTLFWELATLITIMLLGHWLEMRAVAGASGALKALAKLLPDTAEVVRGEKTEIIPLVELKAGDVVLVKPGGKIPADGKIAEGKSDVDEALITGESRPVAKVLDDEVIAGSINGDGSLKIKVNKIGESTFLAGVMRLVAEAQASKSRLQVLSDRAALYLTVIAISTGGLAFVVWFFSGAGAAFSLERFVAVLVIACPHALGLAVPLVASISTTMAAQSGLLIKQRLALEAARKVDTVLFDKTGTLTKGEYGVDAVIPNMNVSIPEVLQLAASINSRSEHPISKALLSETAKQKINILEIFDFQRIPGKGAKAKIGGKEILVGSATLLGESGLEVRAEFKNQINILEKQGKTIIYVISENKLIGSIALADIIREESREAVSAMKKMGVRVAMITGDSEEVAAWVAKELGIDEYFAKVLPEQKSEKVRLLQSGGQKVAMVGDGVNDAPALTQADVGIAIGAGTNVAIESAGIILVKNDPRDIPKIVRLSKITYKKMLQNLFWATGYNVFALPLAAGVLAAKGILLQPAVAAILMSLSTVIVAVNAVLLKFEGRRL